MVGLKATQINKDGIISYKSMVIGYISSKGFYIILPLFRQFLFLKFKKGHYIQSSYKLYDFLPKWFIIHIFRSWPTYNYCGLNN